MDGYLRQSTASQTRWMGPFVDDTDFKTAETALTIANTDIKLSKNGGSSASKNSGGGTHDVNGMYAVTYDATDSATVGELKYSVKVAGALQVFGSYVVVEEAVYDAQYAAGAPGYVVDQPVNTTKVGGTSQTGRDLGASVLLSSGTGTGQLDFTSGVVKANLAQILGTALTETAGLLAGGFKKFFNIATPASTMDVIARVTLTDTATTYTGNTVQTGDAFARLGAPAGASISADIAAVKSNAVTIIADTDDIQTRLPAALTAGGNMKADALALSGDTTAADNAESFFDGTGYAGTNNVIPTVTAVTGLTASNLDATVSSRATPAQVNAEVVDGLNVDTYAEVGQENPAATQSIRKMLAYLYKAWRNRSTQTSTAYKLYADDATTVDQKATVSDNGTTYDSGEKATGP